MNKIMLIAMLFGASNLMVQEKINIRGRIATTNVYTKEKMILPRADLILYSRNANGNWAVVAKTITDPEGLYYFYGINPGTYYLQVNRARNFRIEVRKPDENSPQMQQMQQMNLRKEQLFVDIPEIIF